MSKEEAIKYYTLDKILKENADYNLIIGERSNGKTTACLGYGLEEYCKYGYQLAVIRRYDEDFRGKNGTQIMENLVKLGWVAKFSKGKYNNILYYSQRWYLTLTDEKGIVEKDEKPFAYAFSLTAEQHIKSTSYPDIRNILFDEFLSRDIYLSNEFLLFTSVLSTIIRLRDDVKIFMCGNTINKYCPYFSEMGISNIKKQKKGTIDVYQYGESELKVAVEFSDFPSKNKKSNKYFAFNNPKLKMITEGAWEIDIYPHLPLKYVNSNIQYQYYINFDKELLQCEIIYVDNCLFTYIHRKTTPIKEDDRGYVFQEDYDPRPNYRRKITKPTTPLEKKLLLFFVRDKVFYQDNEVGEIIRNYLEWCKK